ncbi:MAG: hypothetical protein RUDDFDWM_000632 [Candidatus Fervidibacterota bacterium]
MEKNSASEQASLTSLCILLIVFLCLPLLVSMWKPIPYVIERFTPDDAYYYLNTALNIARGYGSTFDRINFTNGYHPLWMLILIPIYSLVGGVEEPLRIVLTLQVIMLSLSMWLSFDVMKRFVSKPLSIIAPMLVYAFVGLAGFYALESHLLVLLSLLAVRFSVSRHIVFESQKVSIDDVLFALLLSLVTLSRLDSVFIFISYIAVLVFQRNRLSIAKLLTVTVAYAVLLVPYLIWNYVHFGHLMPISGALKSAFPNVVFIPRHLLIKPVLVRMAIPLVLSIAYMIMYGAVKVKFKGLHLPLLTFNLYVLLHACYSAFLQDWGVFPWYFALPLAIASLNIPLLLSLLQRSHLLDACIVVLCALLVAIAMSKLFLPSRHAGLRTLYKQAMWLKANTEPDAVCIAEDAGIIGYFSQRRVINLDGLINSYEYQEYLLHGRFIDYIRDKGVRYFIATRGMPQPNKPFHYEAYSHLYNVSGGSIELKHEWRIDGAPIPTWKIGR